jgi:hypothetical protein
MVGKREQRGHNKRKISYMGHLLYPAPTQRKGDKGEPFKLPLPHPPLRKGRKEERAGK